MNSVAALLARGRKAKDTVSALDAVMGNDWAIISPGRARKARQIRTGLRIAHQRDVSRSAGGSVSLPGRKPQAVVKMVRSGGASDLRGLRGQMAYLSRTGREPLERSERYMGLEIDDAQARAIERSWRMPKDGEGAADRTSHFIVSFPQDTNRRDAYQAGRDWAERMFGSGAFGGDRYDYYTAFHTDRDHPHMHVVVYRRGLENGAWLKVSRRSDMNYDRMREELVRVAARSRIELEATARFARGRHDRPVPDAEYRRAAAEGRTPEAPAHTPETAIRAAAALIHYSRVFAGDARRLEREAPEQAELLRNAADDIKHGRELVRRASSAHTLKENSMASSEIEEKRAEVRGNFVALDNSAREIEDRAARMRFLRQIASMKAETAPLLREPGELRAFTEKDESGRYRGIDPTTRQRDAEKKVADERVRAIAMRYDVDGAATLERHSGPQPSQGLARQFEAAEAEERNRTRAARGDAVETPEERRAALSRMHTEIQAVYRQSRERSDIRYDGRGDRPETFRPPAANPSHVTQGDDEVPDRVKSRMERDSQRAESAQAIWGQRTAEHRKRMERETPDQRPQSERETRKRSGGGDDPEETRSRGRRR